ncbi:MAG: Crp/Fnr family transcriptional regulator [Mucilaginibacter sp.]|nr:Crp/Fnr family transcriptional regulator [Mucilaginibacter sp.]
MRNQTKTNRLIGTLVLLTLFVLSALQVSAQGGQRPRPPRVLIYTKAAGFQHASIPVAEAAILKLAAQNHFIAEMSGDPADFNDDNLKKYKAVIFVSTTGNTLPGEEQRAAFKRYIEAGGGYVGIHAATDANYDWPWYRDLAGAWFKGHPAQQMATLTVVDSTTIATKMLPHIWKRVDEWYHFKELPKDVHVLITFDESSITYKPNEEALKMGANHPMAWWHDFDGGRAFYTELGHTDESYSDPLYLQHLLGGIQYAMGVKPMKL